MEDVEEVKEQSELQDQKHKDEIEDLNNELSEAIEKIDALEDQVSEHEEKIGELENQVAEMKSVFEKIHDLAGEYT